MSFTGLHRALGVDPGPISSEMIDQAIAARVIETDDLDWKRELPPERNLTQTDFPKDVAAMANAGGGVIVYGIDEDAKGATQRLDVGQLSETHARALRSAAVSGISPPVFGLEVIELGEEGSRVVAVVIPDSVDVPHLIYRTEYFGAPVRNDADTVWMRERQVDAMYRARFTEQRNAHEALETLYKTATAGRDSNDRAWFIGVARPRVPAPAPPRLTRDEARFLLNESGPLALAFVDRGSVHPLENVSSFSRPGLRSWVFGNSADGEMRRWREAWIGIHDDGSVTLAAAIGGHRTSDGTSTGDVIAIDSLEAALADLMSLINKTSHHVAARDYDLQIGVEWAGDGPITFEVQSGWGGEVTAVLTAYTPIHASIQTGAQADDYYDTVYDVICDAVNQGGVEAPLKMSKRISG